MPVSFRRRNKSFNEPNRDENDKIFQLMPGEAKGSSFQLRPKNNTGSSSRIQSFKDSSSRIQSTSGIQLTSGQSTSMIQSSSAFNSSSLFHSSSVIRSETPSSQQNQTFFINSTQNASIGTSRCSLNGISSLMSEDGTINGSMNSSIYSNNETVGSSQPYKTSLNRSQSSLTQCFKRQFTRGMSYSAETQARKNEALRLQKSRDESNKRDQENEIREKTKNGVKSGGKPVKRTKSFTFNTFSLEKFKPKKRNVVGRSQSTKISGSKSFKLKNNESEDNRSGDFSSNCGNLGSDTGRNFSNLRSCGNLGSRGKLGSLGKLTSAKLGSSGNLEIEEKSQFPKNCRPRFDRDSKARRNMSSNGLPPVHRHVAVKNDVLENDVLDQANADLTSGPRIRRKNTVLDRFAIKTRIEFGESKISTPSPTTSEPTSQFQSDDYLPRNNLVVLKSIRTFTNAETTPSSCPTSKCTTPSTEGVNVHNNIFTSMENNSVSKPSDSALNSTTPESQNTPVLNPRQFRHLQYDPNSNKVVLPETSRYHNYRNQSQNSSPILQPISSNSKIPTMAKTTTQNLLASIKSIPAIANHPLVSNQESRDSGYSNQNLEPEPPPVALAPNFGLIQINYQSDHESTNSQDSEKRSQKSCSSSGVSSGIRSGGKSKSSKLPSKESDEIKEEDEDEEMCHGEMEDGLINHTEMEQYHQYPYSRPESDEGMSIARKRCQSHDGSLSHTFFAPKLGNTHNQRRKSSQVAENRAQNSCDSNTSSYYYAGPNHHSHHYPQNSSVVRRRSSTRSWSSGGGHNGLSRSRSEDNLSTPRSSKIELDDFNVFSGNKRHVLHYQSVPAYLASSGDVDSERYDEISQYQHYPNQIIEQILSLYKSAMATEFFQTEANPEKILPNTPTIASKLNEFRVRKKKSSLSNSREEGLQSILNLPSISGMSGLQSGLQSMSTLQSISGLTISNRPSILSHLLPSISGLQSVSSSRPSQDSRVLLNRSKSMHEICKGYSQHSLKSSTFSSRFTINGEVHHLPAPNHISLQSTPAISTTSLHSSRLIDSSLKTASNKQHASTTNLPKTNLPKTNLPKTSSSHTRFNSSHNQRNNSKVTNQIPNQTNQTNLHPSSSQFNPSSSSQLSNSYSSLSTSSPRRQFINTSQCLISATSAAQMQDEKCLAQDYLGYAYYPYSTNYQYEFTMPKQRYAMNLELYEMLLSDPTVFQFSDPFLTSGESLQMTAPVWSIPSFGHHKTAFTTTSHLTQQAIMTTESKTPTSLEISQPPAILASNTTKFSIIDNNQKRITNFYHLNLSHMIIKTSKCYMKSTLDSYQSEFYGRFVDIDSLVLNNRRLGVASFGDTRVYSDYLNAFLLTFKNRQCPRYNSLQHKLADGLKTSPDHAIEQMWKSANQFTGNCSMDYFQKSYLDSKISGLRTHRMRLATGETVDALKINGVTGKTGLSSYNYHCIVCYYFITHSSNYKLRKVLQKYSISDEVAKKFLEHLSMSRIEIVKAQREPDLDLSENPQPIHTSKKEVSPLARSNSQVIRNVARRTKSVGGRIVKRMTTVVSGPKPTVEKRAKSSENSKIKRDLESKDERENGRENEREKEREYDGIVKTRLNRSRSKTRSEIFKSITKSPKFESVSSKVPDSKIPDSKTLQTSSPKKHRVTSSHNRNPFEPNPNPMSKLNRTTSDRSRGSSSGRGSRGNSADNEIDFSSLSLSDFTRVATLGRGGYAKVHLVKLNACANATYALKCVIKQKVLDANQKRHVRAERDILLTCSSQFIVKLFRTFRDTKYVYFLTEVCLGGELFTLMKQNGPLSENSAKFAVGCIVEAVDYLHSKINVIHRDVKPENMLLNNMGYVKLADFGFAKRLGIGSQSKTKTFCGTPGYLAPEIILRKSHDQAVDYWSIGILVFEVLTCKSPFRRHNDMSTYRMTLRGINCVEFPRQIGPVAGHLVRALCNQDAGKRMGSFAGADEIRGHSWFRGFDWAGLRAQKIGSPIKPVVNGPVDHSNFEKFQDDGVEPPDELSGWDVGF